MITSESEAREFVADRCVPAAIGQLDHLVESLRAENTVQNLVSSNSLANVWQRHIADSAQLLDHVPRGTEPWLDLGTGAGFPGLVIAVMRPTKPVVLVESRAKRAAWLARVCDELGLDQCKVIGLPLERVTPFAAGAISARAFAPLPRLIALAMPFSTSATRWLLPKGRSAAQEVSALPPALQRMFHVEPSLTDADSGIVVGSITEDQAR